MSEFKLPMPAANSHSPAGMLRYAEEVQSYLERHEYYLGRDALDEISSQMCSLTPTIHETAALAGVYKLYEPAESGDITEAEVSLVEGIIGGSSFGFRILPIEDFEPDIVSSKDYESETELFQRIRHRTIGDYVVCHAINHGVATYAALDKGVINSQFFQALGPITNSDLRIFGENDPMISTTAADESTLTLSGLEKPSRKALGKIVEQLKSGADPLESLVTCAPEIRRIIANNNQAVVLALRSVLGHLAGEAGIGVPYIFQDMPPVLRSDPQTGEFQIATINHPEFPVYVEAIDTNFRYFHNRRTSAIIEAKRPEEDLYLDVAQVVHSTQIARYSIPLSLIQPGSFTRLVDLAELQQ